MPPHTYIPDERWRPKEDETKEEFLSRLYKERKERQHEREHGMIYEGAIIDQLDETITAMKYFFGKCKECSKFTSVFKGAQATNIKEDGKRTFDIYCPKCKEELDEQT